MATTEPTENQKPDENAPPLPDTDTLPPPPAKQRRSVLVDKLSKISKNVITRKKKGKKRGSFDESEFGALPPPDYYYQIDENAFDKEDFAENLEEAEQLGFTPVGRNAVEMGSRFFVERNLFSYLANTKIPDERNYYDEDEVDLSCITLKPMSYIILGKPGIGRTTLAKRLAAKLNAVHICPEEVIEYYRFQDVIHHLRVNEVLDSGGSIDDHAVASLVEARVQELDVLHRGYVLDGFPMVTSEELPIEDQIEILQNLSMVPQYAILINMQDVDLYKRRIEQKYDPDISQIYIRHHYTNFNADQDVFPTKRKSQGRGYNKHNGGMRSPASDVADISDFSDSVATSPRGGHTHLLAHQSPVERGDGPQVDYNSENEDEDPLDGTRDFVPLAPDVLFRLITRTEDNPVLVNDDLEQFRLNLRAIQAYVETFDKRKVLELDAYWAPSVLYKRTCEFLEASGVCPVSIPTQIMRPLPIDMSRFRSNDSGEFWGEDDNSEAPCPDDEPPPEIDWESVIRAVSVRGLADPRFRWRISKWYNLCPVALKYGKSIVGKPELATSFLDKVWFLSSQEALEQFIFNPRPYLLPKMPTSPVKFFVFGHPLAGKTTFSKELAFLTNSSVVDMNREMEKRYSQVVHDHLYKKRLQYTLEAKLIVDRENHQAWKKLERSRRAAMHKWVDEFIRKLAEDEIRAAVDAERLRKKTERIEWRKESEFHKLTAPFAMTAGMCQRDESLIKFSWKSFIQSVNGGTTTWTHQELLELAWDLFHNRKLYYKRFKGGMVKLTMLENLPEDDGEYGSMSGAFGDSSSEEESGEEEEPGEVEEEAAMKPTKKKRRRKKNRCRKLHIKPDEEQESVVQQEPDSSDLDPNDNELEESIRMRYPLIPTELVDIVPPPTLVPDHNPAVEDIVNRKLQADEEYVLTLPVELYIEVLKRACSEAEAKYRRHNTHGPLSGGWIVENLVPDIEKFRGILRTPEVCPDSIMLLLDRSENHTDIYKRLKKMFRLKHPILKPNEEMVGEGGFLLDEPGEGFDLQTEIPQQPTTAEFLQSILPVDNLIEEQVKDSPSGLIQKMMDLHRDQTPDYSDCGDDSDDFLTLHERFILEQVRSKVNTQGSSGSYESEVSAGALRRLIAAEFKSTVHEMEVQADEDYSNLSKGEQLKEDVRVISEYMRHSREIGSLSYSQEIRPDSAETEPDSGMSSARSALGLAGEDENETVNGSKDTEDATTPNGLLSAESILGSKAACPEDLTLDEKEKCLREQQKQKIESPKRRFFVQIRLFDEFWNMAIPVCNERGVLYSEIGMADEANARKKAVAFWDEMESRFELKAKKVSENELKEDDEEIHESLMKWGQPYEHNNPGGLPATSESMRGLKRNQGRGFDDDDFSQGGESEEYLGEDGDMLAPLEGKPDVYWKTLKKIEAQRCYGDMKQYCPVTFMELKLLRKGSSQYACKYRDRLYYCSDEESQTKFLKTPLKYLPLGQPKVPPPPRICITGSPGCGQEEVGVKMAKEYNVCYINFRQRMHELMKARFGKHIGPEKTGDIVPRYDSEKLIDKSKSGDDMLKNGGGDTADNENDSDEEEEEEKSDPEEEEEENEDEPREKTPSAPAVTTLYPSVLYPIDEEEATANEAALESLGLVNTARVNTVPIGSIERAERLTDRKFKKLTKIEAYVQAFLENGIQLPDSVLDEFITPLWKEAPFEQVGFVLVGFPNTEADIKYLMKNKYFPEFVYVVDCHPLVIRNRLLIQAVDRWHQLHNPSGKRKKRVSEQDRVKTKGPSFTTAPNAKPTDTKAGQLGFQYQSEGRPVIDDFESETWTYNDNVSSQITRALKHYHSIYSKGIKAMKQSLNKNQIDWMPLNTDLSLIDGKRTLEENITPKLKNRSNLFEDIVTLNLKEAEVLLNKHIFEMSKFQRWSPVELSKGNTAINLWNAPGVQKVPILYRRYIYFLATEKNAKVFEENCWNLVNQQGPMNSVPAVIVVMGPPKSGKTSLAQRLANRLGFEYISGPEIIESVVKHSFVSQWADVFNDLEPAILKDRPQPMVLSEEVLNYIRNGQTLPKFIVYRILDLALMQPKAQYHGVILDDYPVTEEELQELLYRGLVPSSVIKLSIDKTEAYQRCDKTRAPDYNYQDLPEEGRDMIDYATAVYEQGSETTLFWFQNEVQNLLELDGTQNIEWLYQQVAQKCKVDKRQMQNYLVNVLLERPSTLEGTCPLTSQLPLRLSPDFGFYCPVALNDTNDLIRVAKITDLSEVVEYKGFVYIFSSSHNAHKFLVNPNKYIPPNCKLIPPATVPVTTFLTTSQFEELKLHWGFEDFDPVRFYDANHHYKGLQRGDAKFCTAYKSKLYCFVNNENLQKFMKKPERYWNLLLPAKVPRKTEPMDLEKISSYNYLLAKGVLSNIKKVLQVTGERRPRVPFMSSEKCAALFMGYYFKAQNMNAPYDVRQKYRAAMFDMMTTKNDTRKFLTELQDYYGCRMRTLPERLRTKLDNFIGMEHKKDEERVLVPTIPGTSLCKAGIDLTVDDREISEKYQKTKELLTQADQLEKMKLLACCRNEER